MSSGHGADSAPAPYDKTATDTTHSTGATRATGTGTEEAAQTAENAQAGQAAQAARAARALEGADTARDEKTSMFSSLRVRNYRLFWIGQSVSNTGTWMQRIAQDWLVLSLTGSATAVGITTALQFLPMLLFGLYGGVLADRCNKRRLLLLTQSTMGVTGVVLAVLTLSGQVHVTHVYALAFALGLATVVDNPTRQTFVSEMVGPRMLRNAVSLNSANFQSARLVGPAVAGVMISAVGSGWAFLFNGLSFLAPIISLAMIRTGELYATERAPRGKGQLREGLAYVRSRPDLLWTIVLVGFIGTFGFNFPIWLTAFTDRVFEAGAGTYGLLNTLIAIGSLAGALLAARRTVSRMRLMLGAALLFGILEIAAALTPSFWLFAALMLPIGVMGLTFNVTANSSVQLASDPAMRGRVMSLYMMVFVGGTPIGGPLMGWITDVYGARVGFLAGGLISAVIAVGVTLALARASGLRLRFRWGNGRRVLAFVPRDPADASGSASGPAPAPGAAEPEREPSRARERVPSAA